MADFNFRKESEDEQLLIISFENGMPISAAQLSTILKALDADYTHMTGRHLLVARLELGSTWIWIVDAAAVAGEWIKGAAGVAKSAQELGTFAKKLSDGFKLSKASGPLPQTGAGDDSVNRSITAMAKACEKTGSTIRLRKTTRTESGIETIDIKVAPPQAMEALVRAKKRPKITSHAVQDIGQFYELIGSMRALPQASSDLESGIRAMVRAAVMNGGRSVLEQVAETLESEGRADIASIIRLELERRPDARSRR